MIRFFLKFLSWCPGAFGLLLRQKIYPCCLGKCGRNVLFGRFVTFKGRKKIHIGNSVVINDHALLDAEVCRAGHFGITLEDHVFVGSGTRVHCCGESIHVHNKANLGSECRIFADTPIVIGEHVLLAAYCLVGGKRDTIEKGNYEQQDLETVSSSAAETTIGNGCWLGVRAVFRSGVCIGDNTIIGAHAIVEHDLPAQVVAIGYPAEVLYSR